MLDQNRLRDSKPKTNLGFQNVCKMFSFDFTVAGSEPRLGQGQQVQAELRDGCEPGGALLPESSTQQGTDYNL